MKTLKLLHYSDSHCRKEYYAEIMASMGVVKATGKSEAVDLFINAGDTWDGPILDTKGSRFTEFTQQQSDLADIAPLVTVYGIAHDTDGSLEILEQLANAHGITILREGIAYFLAGGKITTTPTAGTLAPPATALIFGIPEQQKKWLLAGAGAMGKDEADAAIRDALRKRFLDLAGIRKQYPELPCILVYHGQVAGARTGVGYEIGGGIAISREDLAVVGADYIALGDNHEPQQIPGLPAYYSGSIVPQGWGETHKAGCNLVEITRGLDPEDSFGAGPDQFNTEVTRVEFPHPRNRKVCLRALRNEATKDLFEEGGIGFDGDIPVPVDFLAEKCWIEISGPRDVLAGIDTDILCQRLLDSGFLPGSKVTTAPDPEETVRVAGIAKKKRVRDKVRTWADATALVVPAGVPDKADELELLFAAAGGAGIEHRWQLLFARIRGSIGLWKNQRKDEIVIDFRGYGPGVLAVVGRNGTGKTTIFENLHPWLQMLTRKGALKKHFRLRDSARELWYLDQYTGKWLRVLININAATDSGGTECYLYESADEGATWEALPGMTGRQEPYEKAVAELFGSLDLFRRTAFVTQKNTKDAPALEDATAGQKKALFFELSGIDRYKVLTVEAKARADAIATEIVSLDATIAAAADVDAAITELEAKIETAATEAQERGQERDRLQDQVQAFERGHERLRDDVAALEIRVQRRQEIVAERGAIAEGIKSQRQDLEILAAAVVGKAEAEAELKRLLGLDEELKRLQNQDAELGREYEDAVKTHNTKVDELKTARTEIRKRITDATTARAMVETEIAVAEDRLRIPLASTCPTCGQILPETTRKRLEEERAKMENGLTANRERKRAHDEAVKELEAELAAMVDLNHPERKKIAEAERLQALELELKDVDREPLQALVKVAQSAAAETKKHQALIDNGLRRDQVLAQELEAISQKLNKLPALQAQVANAAAGLANARTLLTNASTEAAAARATADEARRTLEAATERRRRRDLARATFATKSAELLEWRFLERACGNDGFPALELDELAPGIAEVANKLLAGARGNRHQIKFDTQRDAGTGAKTKRIEDFLITIRDNELGTDQDLDTVCGGEGIWFKKAIYDAFAVICAQNTGIQFQTVLADEADGALDPEARQQYLRMLEAAHRESGRWQTILISHSTEIQQMVDQVLDVSELRARPEPVAVEASA